MSCVRGVDGPGRPLMGVRGDVAVEPFVRGELAAVALLCCARRRRDMGRMDNLSITHGQLRTRRWRHCACLRVVT